MKTASVRELKTELKSRSKEELIELCLGLGKFKKENKELLTYLLYESDDEALFIKNIKEEIKSEFQLINTSSFFFIKKSIRKILRMVKKYIRYSKKKETEVELLFHFCLTLKQFKPSIVGNTAMEALYQRQKELITKAISSLHEDLQYDYQLMFDQL